MRHSLPESTMMGAERILKKEVTLGTELVLLTTLSPPRTFACSLILCCSLLCFHEGNYYIPRTLLLELPA